MIAFWIAAALLAGAAVGLIVHRAARAEMRAATAEDPSLAVYRRQLDEIDELSANGLLPSDEHRSARAEAARRLLAANDRSKSSPEAARGGRWLVLATAAVGAVLALGAYFVVGSPGTPDQPFTKRLAAWRKADPQTLDAPQMVAVLSAMTVERPNDPKLLYFLARADLAAGDAFASERALRKALTLAPRQPELWTALGMVLSTDNGGDITPDALKAFQQAHAIAPAAPDPRYFLARARIASGDVKGGLDDWRALVGDLPSSDQRRAAVLQEIATVEKAGGLPSAVTPAPPADTGAFIQSMVDRLAAKLQAQPDDPEGWGRLIRAYGVLGDSARRQAAVDRAHQLFNGRPEALAAVDAASAAPAGQQ